MRETKLKITKEFALLSFPFVPLVGELRQHTVLAPKLTVSGVLVLRAPIILCLLCLNAFTYLVAPESALKCPQTESQPV